MAPPTAATISVSTSTRPTTKPSVKPTVLSTASSPVRSRTDMAMVLPVTSSRVKNTTPPMARIRNSMLPNCVTKPCMNALSDWVRVSKAEFANFASMARATSAAFAPFSQAHHVPADVVLAKYSGPSRSSTSTGTRTG